jgi:hypothetical protein
VRDGHTVGVCRGAWGVKGLDMGCGVCHSGGMVSDEREGTMTADEIRARREARGMSDPTNVLVATVNRLIADGAEPVVEQLCECDQLERSISDECVNATPCPSR